MSYLRVLLVGFAFIVGAVKGEMLSVQLPDGCAPVLGGLIVSCMNKPPPPVCPPPQTGTPPNCVNPPPPITCEGYSKVINLTENWGAPQTLYSGSMGPNDVMVVAFTTGVATNPNQYGNITGAEYQSQPSTRVAALATHPCDFSNALGAGSVSVSNTVTGTFSVGPNSSNYYPALLPLTTYYWNVKNQAGSTCAASSNCNMYVQLHKPPGT